MTDLYEKRPLGLEVLAEDLSLSNEEGNSWYAYGPATSDDRGEFIPVEEYADDGSIAARYRMSVIFERQEDS